MKILATLVFFLTFSQSIFAQSEISMTARSISEHCQFIYQIETEFRLVTSDKEVSSIKVWLFDLYTETYLEPQTFEAKQDGEAMKVDFVINTMSTNPKYLSHDIFFSLVKAGEEAPPLPTFKTKFSQLMNRCYDRAHRDAAPFEVLNIQEVNR